MNLTQILCVIHVFLNPEHLSPLVPTVRRRTTSFSTLNPSLKKTPTPAITPRQNDTSSTSRRTSYDILEKVPTSLT